MNLIPLKKTSSTDQYDLNLESDRQMLIRIGKKFALIFVVILMFDSLLDWSLGIIDLMLEGLHLIIEAIEYSIELILEHTLHTDHHHSEMIIVNGTIVITLYLLYRFFRATPRLLSLLEKKCLFQLNKNFSCWQSAPLLRKVKLSTLYCLGLSCVLFLLTL